MLRVGIVLDSYLSYAWIARIIEGIQSSQFATIPLVILHAPSKQEAPSPAAKLAESWKSGLFHRYEQWDYKRNSGPRNALASADLSSLLLDIPRRTIPPSNSEASHSNVDDLDVLLCLGSLPSSTPFTRPPRFGIWSVHPDEWIGPPIFWQIFDRSPVSQSTLQVRTDIGKQSHAFLKTSTATDQASLYRSRNPVYWKMAELVLHGLREVHERGIGVLEESALQDKSSSSAGRVRTLNTPVMLAFMGQEAARWVKARIASYRSEAPPKWCIGIRPRNNDRRFDNPSGYGLMPSAKDRFYADPFLFEKDGKTWLFFEDFRYADDRALISCCALSADGRPGNPVEVLSRPYHLSYPFVFEDEGQVYMIPETRGNRTVELYRADIFPHSWVLESVLLSDIYAVDATIQRLNGKLWMFTGLSNGDYSNSDELALFSAPSLKGPWMPHPRNPVVSDVQRARPAGMLFYEEGRLIRPSQDCGKAYGYGLVFSEILTLNETQYEERPISRMNPELTPHALSNHTYNRTEHFEVIDRTLPAAIAQAADATWPNGTEVSLRRKESAVS